MTAYQEHTQAEPEGKEAKEGKQVDGLGLEVKEVKREHKEPKHTEPKHSPAKAKASEPADQISLSWETDITLNARLNASSCAHLFSLLN